MKQVSTRSFSWQGARCARKLWFLIQNVFCMHKRCGWATLFAKMIWSKSLERYEPEGHFPDIFHSIFHCWLLELQASCCIPGRGPPATFKQTKRNKKAQLFQWKLICNNLFRPKTISQFFYWETSELSCDVRLGTEETTLAVPLSGCDRDSGTLQVIDFGVKIKPIRADWSRGLLIDLGDRLSSRCHSDGHCDGAQAETGSRAFLRLPQRAELPVTARDPCQWSASTFEDLESSST